MTSSRTGQLAAALAPAVLFAALHGLLEASATVAAAGALGAYPVLAWLLYAQAGAAGPPPRPPAAPGARPADAEDEPELLVLRLTQI